jgi:isoleucyl-tRNA synthetase
MNLGKANNLPFVQHVSMDGKFKSEVTDFAGQLVKPIEDHQKADIMVIKYLAGKNSLLAKEKITHSYPHCWRCETPLLNYATSSWFVRVSDPKLKSKLLSENKNIGWYPEEIGSGRFGKWLEGARDWAISRTRFWGAPIPVWRCAECKATEVLGTIEDIHSKIGNRNTYYVMRHGESEYNVRNIISDVADGPDPLTKSGINGVKSSAKKLKKVKFDLIISSPFLRTKQTAEIVAKVIGYPEDKIIFDSRLREVFTDGFTGKTWKEFNKFAVTPEGEKSKRERPEDTAKRVYDFMKDIHSKYSGKKILIVSHGSPIEAFQALSNGARFDNSSLWGRDGNANLVKRFANAEFQEIRWIDKPRNSTGRIDFHRPHIDSVEYECKCGGKFKRIPDVFDCWFESGSVPYGQNHYICQPDKYFDPKKNKAYPSEFIGEGLDQTRGWFYTMHILGVALFGKSSYKNVMVNGLILAEDGKKMSKKLKNYPDPIELINKYGVDAVRYYLLSSPVISAQEIRFSEKGVDEVSKKIIARLYSVLSFIDMYGDVSKIKNVNSKNTLDIWIKTRLAEVGVEMTKSLEAYALDKASRPVSDFVEDLSNWYLRRSRDRLRGDDGKDKNEALATLVYIMKEFSKLIAPIMPFTAEVIYRKLKTDKDPESVHLLYWPKFKFTNSDRKSLEAMSEVRALVELGHFARQESKINVRQPLSEVILNIPKIDKKFVDIIADELNVKQVSLLGKKNPPESGYVAKDDGRGMKVFLNTVITDDLKEEGRAREILRMIQDERKKMGLVPKDEIAISVRADETKTIIEKYLSSLMKVANIKAVIVSEQSEEIKIRKI